MSGTMGEEEFEVNFKRRAIALRRSWAREDDRGCNVGALGDRSWRLGALCKSRYEGLDEDKPAVMAGRAGKNVKPEGALAEVLDGFDIDRYRQWRIQGGAGTGQSQAPVAAREQIGRAHV